MHDTLGFDLKSHAHQQSRSPNERRGLSKLMRSTAASLPPIAAHSLRNCVTLEGALGLSTPLYMMGLHPWSFSSSKRKRGRLLHILPPSDCDDPNRVGATRAVGSS